MLIASAVMSLAQGGVCATDYTWMGAGGNANWSNTGNWSPSTGYPNGSGDTVQIAAGGGSTATMDTGGMTSSLTFQRGGDFAIDGGSTLILYGGTLTVNDNFNYTISAPLRMSSSGAFTNNGSGALTVGAIDPQGSQLTWNTSSSSDAVTGIINNATLVKSGTGTLTLSADNTYTGKTTVSAGTLRISSDSNLGTAPGAAQENIVIGGQYPVLGITETMTLNAKRGITLSTSGASINVAGGKTVTYDGIIAGTAGGSFSKSGAGTLILGGVNTTNSQAYASEGKLVINSGGSIGNVIVSSGTLGGTGTAGTVAIVSGGTIMPGSADGTAYGTLTTGAETWYGGSTYDWLVAGNSGSLLDMGVNQLNLNNVTSGSRFAIKITGTTTGTSEGQTFTIAQYGSLSKSFASDLFTVTNNAGGYFTLSGNESHLQLTYSAVPEPSVVGLFLMSLPFVGAAGRRLCAKRR